MRGEEHDRIGDVPAMRGDILKLQARLHLVCGSRVL